MARGKESRARDNPGELIKHFGNRFERRARYRVELQSYSLIAALRACVSAVIKIVTVHLQPVAMFDQQHMTKTKWSRHFLQIEPTNLSPIHFVIKSATTSAAISN